MRLFLAINLPAVLKKQLFELGRPLKAMGDVNPVEEANIHVTLKFLGDAEPASVIKSLESVRAKPFDISLKGVGVFPKPDYVRVVWAGCEKGAQEMVTLHQQVETALPQFEKEKEFHPHATLARVKFLSDKKAMADFLGKNKETAFGSFKAESFELMKSELRSSGPIYGLVKSFPLIE
jgi:2'-5' RNA ligase